MVRPEQLAQGEPEEVLARRRAERERNADHDELVALRAERAALHRENQLLRDELAHAQKLASALVAALGRGQGRLMGRPRKGVQFQDGRFNASLPVAVGSKKTRQFTDADERAVRRWYADGERALATGHPLPDPAAYRTGRSTPDLAALAPGERTPASWWAGPTAAYGHRIDRVSEAFVVHRYDRQRSGRPERRGAEVATIANDLLPFFAQNRVSVTTVRGGS
jgi:hypothetical protein